MTDSDLAAFLSVVGVVLGVWSILFFFLPYLMRTRFEYRAMVLRDECQDAVLDGVLPDTPPVRAFLDRARVMTEEPKSFNLATALAVHATLSELKYRGPSAPSYGSLSAQQRKLLHHLDDELHRAFVDRLVHGSSFGWALLLGVGVSRLIRRLLHGLSPKSPTPQILAREYSAVSDGVDPWSLHGLDVSRS